jgi:thiosulfate/3-mercaptopyruvate sulfurtransferase
MLPPAEQFARQMSALGLSDGDDIVVYDGSGANLSAARAWWTFRVFGHDRVAVLDGGLGRWRANDRPVEPGAVRLAPGQFSATLDRRLVRSLADIQANLGARREQVVDARPGGRFAGADPEPRPGLRGGHIPGSLSLPYHALVAPDGTLLPPHELRARLQAAGVDLTRPVVATCGSGTSACAIALALEVLGRADTAIYDGSWTEWGGRADTPVETGTP